MTPADQRLRELGAFLRGRRDRLAPAPVTEPRRVTGLRRAEVAAAAGVSIGYYVRLEQGRGGPPSTSVLDALARALRLDENERAHLHSLADTGGNRRSTAVTPDLIDRARTVLDLVAPPSPAYVIDRVSDVLAWNVAAAALFAGHLRHDAGSRPNNVRYIFLDPAAKRLFARWDEVAEDAVAHLRATVGYRPDDPALRALSTRLAAESADFAQRWERRHVRPCLAGRKLFDHPSAGRLELDYTVLEIPGTCHHRLIAYSAPKGSADARALEELSAAGPGTGRNDGAHPMRTSHVAGPA
jgi:transcriptional regulator with XRE-family HTH domain